jgi:hypothetical protein
MDSRQDAMPDPGRQRTRCHFCQVAAQLGRVQVAMGVNPEAHLFMGLQMSKSGAKIEKS